MKNKEKILIILLKKVTPDTPNSNFTKELMAQINTTEELKSDPLLTRLLYYNEVPLSNDFTQTLLSKIHTTKTKNSTSIISEKSKWVFAATMVILIIASFLVTRNPYLEETTRNYSLKRLLDIVQITPQKAIIVFVCFISVSILLFIDFKLKDYFSSKWT
ncbi:MAG: hypothetical protein V3U92_12800 [Cellulophaga sp.]